jgi:Flp pilus assembly protein TadD
MLLTRNPDDIEGMDRALELATRFENSANPIYRDTLGWVMLNRGDLETALKHLEFAAEGAPDNAEIQYHLGKAYKQTGRNTDAKIHLERAIASKQAFPGDAEAKTLLESM